MRPERTVALPERREDGTWKFPLQVVVMNCGKWQGFGHARFEVVGWASDLAHVAKLRECLL